MPTTRRQFLNLAGSVTVAGTIPIVTLRPLEATPAMLTAAIRNVVGEAPVRTGKVKLDIPPLVENGNTVPLTVSVASPMTANDYVKSIHVFNEKNPQPNIGNFHLGPSSGRAQISTRIRLADTQKVVAIARLSDDTFWQVTTEIVVTLAACTEEMN
ncbi:SoxY-related AACIE arm protein [Bradyrhizobium sp. 44]|jgi:sulfur-oxidizing protein SoxY|uniref:SoxY-related AACIE arm protein n=1 Tax=unclassified Bradyrhizobium TaxID=2631580 RepID=UPI000484D7C4|nr:MULTISPECIES: SoxY-related AACIE arm protein [unclassified Bradyrhizobium]MCK1282357.1 SoxY-related AACIE arm protein [Bradyrhizobium sp. 44]MCK1401224.1 SoxY-related AACIE arm protein [Bradyrhizobium sp. 39]MCK1405662.1 SoxY-related AACIE arm protein [Bradyrhizobium sp. 76]MCK1752969.1 SoxY-related AACIE arm protein [Bradyrhizobium sp. 135]UPJ37158.1 SoxY-related AACIE arm protein [Bradyrhizobium sp. 4]